MRAAELRPEFTADTGEGIGLIWAEAAGRAIGRAGTMPWFLPEDLQHFKRVTWGAPVIMGRRTWESLPARVRPLPGRENVVVSRTPGFEAPGASVVTSLDAALQRTRGVVRAEAAAQLRRLAADPGASCADPGVWPTRAAWVIGGGELYRAALPLARELAVTRIELEVPDADTVAPEIGPEFALAEDSGPLVSRTGLHYRLQRWHRAEPLP